MAFKRSAVRFRLAPPNFRDIALARPFLAASRLPVLEFLIARRAAPRNFVPLPCNGRQSLIRTFQADGYARLSRNLWTLPLGVFGSSSMNSISRG